MIKNVVLVTLAVLAISCRGDNGGPTALPQPSDTLSDRMMGEWYTVKLRVTNQPDSTYDSVTFNSLLQVGDSTWVELAKRNATTVRSAFTYQMVDDSSVNVCKEDRGICVDYEVEFVGDTLHLHFHVDPDFDQHVYYLPWHANVPPNTWPQDIVDGP